MKKLLVVVATVVACGGSSSVALDELAAQVQSAWCKNQVECQYYPDVATCNAAYEANDDYYRTMVAAVTAKRATYDEGLGGDCVTEIENQGCAFTGFQAAANDPCIAMFKGKVAAGGSCFEQPECADQGTCNYTDDTCDPSTACCTGSCVAASAKAPIGATCSTTADCVTGTYCGFTSMTCTALATTENTACDGFDGCANPMLCNYDFTTNTFTNCYTPAARNAACNPNLFIPCADDRDYCDTTTMTCTQNVAQGAGCQGSNGAQCVGFDECVNAFCAARPSVQQACTVQQTGFSDCLGTLACTNSTCAQPTFMSCE
ncbi:MAG TPA: hypothetical protein VMJ10_34000 [Kofleriaceae bacterium]|nr:hypothetical protein [Kofleriaceae bacterium]